MRTGFSALCTVALISLAAACSKPATETTPAAETTAAGEAEAMDTPAEVGIPSGERGGMCAGIAAIQCIDAADYCMMATGQCSMPDASGVCTQKPEACTEEMAPVCGCDGQTYSNACTAAAAGVNVASEGECSPA